MKLSANVQRDIRQYARAHVRSRANPVEPLPIPGQPVRNSDPNEPLPIPGENTTMIGRRTKGKSTHVEPLPIPGVK